MSRDTGFINAYNSFKGFGFIRRDKGKDVHFLIDDFVGSVDIDSIVIGCKVIFDVSKMKKGPRALNIEKIVHTSL